MGEEVGNESRTLLSTSVLIAGPPARHGSCIKNESGETIGEVTSGCPSPSLGGSIAMGYVETSHSKSGTQVLLEVRGKTFPGLITKMPFIPAKYYQ